MTLTNKALVLSGVIGITAALSIAGLIMKPKKEIVKYMNNPSYSNNHLACIPRPIDDNVCTILKKYLQIKQDNPFYNSDYIIPQIHSKILYDDLIIEECYLIKIPGKDENNFNREDCTTVYIKIKEAKRIAETLSNYISKEKNQIECERKKGDLFNIENPKIQKYIIYSKLYNHFKYFEHVDTNLFSPNEGIIISKWLHANENLDDMFMFRYLLEKNNIPLKKLARMHNNHFFYSNKF